MKELNIYGTNKKALVDDEDYPLLSRYKWHFDHKEYVKSSIFNTTVKLHRMIMAAPKSLQVDHINGDKLDNRKCNLRLCDNASNQANKKKRPLMKGKPTSSRFKGVHYRKDRKEWSARIGHKNKRIDLGSYKNEEDAAIAYNKAALKYHGEFASLNKID